MRKLENGNKVRSSRVILSVGFMMTLVGCGGFGLLPHETKISTTQFESYSQVEAAYANVEPGTTRLSELQKLGFDAASTPNVEVLSYLGVIERFMPRNSLTFDKLAKPVQDCILAQDRCTAFVFHPEHIESRRMGSLFLDLLGFERDTVKTGWAAEVVLLMQDGRVAYKLMSGHPKIEDTHSTVQPLGPLQDIGSTMMRTATRLF
jgi:hypothetical protein